MREQAQVGGDLVNRTAERGEHREDVRVLLARVGLAGDQERPVEAIGFGHPAIEFLDLGVVAVEQGQETRLGAGGALHPAKPQVLGGALQRFEVHHQILQPQRAAFAHGGELGGLEVGVAQSRQRLLGLGEYREAIDRLGALQRKHAQTFAHQDQVGIVGDIARRGAEVNNRRRQRGNRAEGMHVGHHIVATPLLLFRGHRVIDVVEVRLHLRDLLGADRQPQAALSLGQLDPQPPPRPESTVVRENGLHLFGGVA